MTECVELERSISSPPGTKGLKSMVNVRKEGNTKFLEVGE